MTDSEEERNYESPEYSEGSEDADDDGERDDVLHYRNRSLQSEVRQAIENISFSDVRGRTQWHSLYQDYTSADCPEDLKMRTRSSLFSSENLHPPPKNVHAVRRHLFLEKHKIKNPADRLEEWKQDDDISLLDVVRAQIMEELFRKIYHGKVQSVPPLDRPQFFMDVQREISEMSSEDLWKNLDYKADWHRIAKRMKARGYLHSAKECYLRYLHHLHPALHKGRFVKAED